MKTHSSYDLIKDKWEKIIEEALDVLTALEDINKLVENNQIDPLAEKIHELNRNLKHITNATLLYLLTIDKRKPLVCDNCHAKMDTVDGELICENPLCQLNG